MNIKKKIRIIRRIRKKIKTKKIRMTIIKTMKKKTMKKKTKRRKIQRKIRWQKKPEKQLRKPMKRFKSWQ